MPFGRHCRHHLDKVCSCEMGNLYRYIEPVVLNVLARLGTACGYMITKEAGKTAVTHAGIDTAVVYRTLQRFEKAGMVISSQALNRPGPPQKLYSLTEQGRRHTGEWAEVLDELITALTRLRDECKSTGGTHIQHGTTED